MPAIDTTYFPSNNPFYFTSYDFWSATPAASDDNTAWHVEFAGLYGYNSAGAYGEDNMNNKGANLRVRLVRSDPAPISRKFKL